MVPFPIAQASHLPQLQVTLEIIGNRGNWQAECLRDDVLKIKGPTGQRIQVCVVKVLIILNNLGNPVSLFSNSHKYKQLLITLIFVFFVAPFLKSGIGAIVSALLLLYTIVVIIRSFALPPLLFWLYGTIALLAFVFQVIASLGFNALFNPSLDLIAQGIFALYFGGATYWIGRDLLTTPQVTIDTVRGGISIYLLIGLVWALFYGMVATVDSQAFSPPLEIEDSYLRTLHFSFTTLTTLGYGNIVPVSDVALVLTNLQAIVGQMYPSVFIGILVGSYLSKRASD